MVIHPQIMIEGGKKTDMQYDGGCVPLSATLTLVYQARPPPTSRKGVRDERDEIEDTHTF